MESSTALSSNIPKAKFDQRKALHAILFVVTHLPKPANVYNVLKCLYYADRKHLQEYRRQIYGETASRLAARGVIQSLEDLVVPGRVLRLFCSFTNPPKEKFVVIVATNPFCLG